MPVEPESEPPAAASPRARRRFYAAVALWLAWLAFLVGLAATDSYRPQKRAGGVPDAVAPADD